MIFRLTAIVLAIVATAYAAHAGEAFKYQTGTVVYSSKALICTDPIALDEGIAMLKIKAFDAFIDFGKCEILDVKSTGAVVQNIGSYVNVMLALPSGKAKSVWAYNGYFMSKKDIAWVECSHMTPNNSKCIDLADEDSWEE